MVKISLKDHNFITIVAAMWDFVEVVIKDTLKVENLPSLSDLQVFLQFFGLFPRKNTHYQNSELLSYE